MITSMWNMCKTACPAPGATDKINEYKSNFSAWGPTDKATPLPGSAARKNSNSGGQIKKKDHLVIAKQPNYVINKVMESSAVTTGVSHFGNMKNQESMGETGIGGFCGSRKKKCPEFSNRCNDILPMSHLIDLRAKSEDRSLQNHHANCVPPGGATVRSKSAEPAKGESPPINTEYRMSFGWPPAMSRSDTEAVRGSHGQTESAPDGPAKKSATIANFGELHARQNGRSNVLFAREAAGLPVTTIKPVKKTEYKKKFRPFSAYVYVSGNGWKKPKDVDPNVDDAHDWFTEVAERGKQASQFRSRSQFGHPVSGVEHLEEIYRESTKGLWSQPRETSRDLSALSLATTQMVISEKKAERENSGSRTSSPNKATSATTKASGPRPRTAIGPRTAPQEGKGSSAPGGAKGDTQPSSAQARGANNNSKVNGSVPPPLVQVGATREGGKGSPRSPKSGERSPRPTTFPGSGISSFATTPTNGECVKATAPETKNTPRMPEGPVKTTDIKSPEEMTGVKSPPPETWAVELDNGSPLNWTNGKVDHTGSSPPPSLGLTTWSAQVQPDARSFAD
ncbi:hypothetical protein HDE_04938 [Halotydeus destructor]|nr:hypothetical protein HDE_04938 [Halotydeus destructor]